MKTFLLGLTLGLGAVVPTYLYHHEIKTTITTPPTTQDELQAFMDCLEPKD